MPPHQKTEADTAQGIPSPTVGGPIESLLSGPIVCVRRTGRHPAPVNGPRHRKRPARRAGIKACDEALRPGNDEAVTPPDEAPGSRAGAPWKVETRGTWPTAHHWAISAVPGRSPQRTASRQHAASAAPPAQQDGSLGDRMRTGTAAPPPRQEIAFARPEMIVNGSKTHPTLRSRSCP